MSTTLSTASLNNVSRERGLDALPENVRTAMKLNGGFIERHDWDVGKSRPLTARRIRAFMEGSHRLTKAQWLSAVNAAYRENPNGKIQIDVETGTVTFV